MLSTSSCIRNARVPSTLLKRLADQPVTGASEAVDIWIDDTLGLITDITPAGKIQVDTDINFIDQDWGIVLRGTVDVHTHLDKYGIWQRSPNTTGDFKGAVAAARADWPAQGRQDLFRRMNYALQVAYAQGTVALRSHLDSVPNQMAERWAVADQLRNCWSNKINLQFVHLSDISSFADRVEARHDLRIVADYGGLLGGVVRSLNGLSELLANLFTLASEFSLDVDLHVDEHLKPGAHGVMAVMQAMYSTGFQGRLTLGHCCALSTLQSDQLHQIATQLRDSGIGIITLPIINEFLQDRSSINTPTYRGIPPLRELIAEGIDIAIASDNCRDPFYPFGDLNLIEVLANTLRIAHLDINLETLTKHLMSIPAKMMGLEGQATITAGAPADLVLFRGRSITEILARPDSVHRRLMRSGQMIDSSLPDFRLLDEGHERPAK